MAKRKTNAERIAELRKLAEQTATAALTAEPGYQQSMERPWELRQGNALRLFSEVPDS